MSEPRERAPQLAYSDIQSKMHDEQGRRTKARKIVRVLHHFLGVESLQGRAVLDIGCSSGYLSHELALDGADTTGLDIDEPGLAAARERFGDVVTFVLGSGDAIPADDGSYDVVVLNHIYEHVVDADAVVAEIRRVLRPDGVAYLGLGNKYMLMEPHYRLPLLSWLPQRLADAYVRRTGKADVYYEQHRSRSGLRRMLRGFHVYDYTLPVVRHPEVFGSGDQVPGAVARLPLPVLQALSGIVPTYVWLATKQVHPPARRDAADGLAHLDLTR